MTNDDALARAVTAFRAGKLQDAAAVCRDVLAGDPFDVDALHLLGAVSARQGDPAAAVEYLQRALQLAPQRADVGNTLGLALLQAGRASEAAEALREATASAPDFARAHCHLGEALRAVGDLDGAVAAYRRSLELEPGEGQTLAALGETLHSLDRPGEAVDVLRKAADALPNHAAVRAELADALQTMGRLDEAEKAYRAALALEGDLGRALYGLGCAQLAGKRYADAAGTFERILAAGAEHAPTHHNLAKAVFELGRASEATAHFRQAAALDPAGPAAGALAVSIPGDPAADNQTVLDTRKAWFEALGPPPAPRGPAGGVANRPIRIGYLSGFFADRNWMKPVWGLINRHDRERFQVHLFSDGPRSAIRHGYRDEPADRFHDISALSNEQAAAVIADRQLDLLIDLNGYSDPRRLGLLAAKPAPVLAGWFNLYATTGMASFDYLIGDAHVIPTEEERFYTERIVRVPGSYLTFEVQYPVPDVVGPPCLRTGRFTFGCLASQYKITPQVAAAWAAILLRAPDSRLLLKNGTLGQDDCRRYVLELFEGLGIRPGRIELRGPSEHYAFLGAYDEVDLALDPFPYNGGTTTTEAIWQGVPVLTYWGDRWAARTSATILREGGLGEFVAADADDYVARAVAWATDPAAGDKLRALRAAMRDQLRASAVCDTETFARNMEASYRSMVGG